MEYCKAEMICLGRDLRGPIMLEMSLHRLVMNLTFFLGVSKVGQYIKGRAWYNVTHNYPGTWTDCSILQLRTLRSMVRDIRMMLSYSHSPHTHVTYILSSLSTMPTKFQPFSTFLTCDGVVEMNGFTQVIPNTLMWCLCWKPPLDTRKTMHDFDPAISCVTGKSNGLTSPTPVAWKASTYRWYRNVMRMLEGASDTPRITWKSPKTDQYSVPSPHKKETGRHKSVSSSKQSIGIHSPLYSCLHTTLNIYNKPPCRIFDRASTMHSLTGLLTLCVGLLVPPCSSQRVPTLRSPDDIYARLQGPKKVETSSLWKCDAVPDAENQQTSTVPSAFCHKKDPLSCVAFPPRRSSCVSFFVSLPLFFFLFFFFLSSPSKSRAEVLRCELILLRDLLIAC